MHGAIWLGGLEVIKADARRLAGHPTMRTSEREGFGRCSHGRRQSRPGSEQAEFDPAVLTKCTCEASEQICWGTGGEDGMHPGAQA